MSLRFRQEIQALPRQAGVSQDRGEPLVSPLASPILVLGAPRSGTTWLAKILDSHPAVLYRHEPDAILPPPAGLTKDQVPGLVERWVTERSARTAGKRPFFPKSWQPAWARGLRLGIAGAAGLCGHLPGPLRRLSELPIPDLATGPIARAIIKSIDWAEGAAVLAQALPDSRIILVLRHPCGQVSSVMRGNRQRYFDLKMAGTDMPFDEERAIRYAARNGTGASAFRNLSAAGQYAWSWRAFNEPAYAALAPMPNVLVVLYEALCARPETFARRLLSFSGLSWSPQTQEFVRRSTSHRGSSGYYTVFRDAVAAADAWRSTMPPEDADAVRGVVSASPLARFWPDLTEGFRNGGIA